MKIYRVMHPMKKKAVFAVRDGEAFRHVDERVEGIHRAIWSGEPLEPTGEPFTLGASPEFLAPVAPTKVVCIGLNYRHHAQEMGKVVPEEPLMFMKPASAVIGGSGAAIELPASSELVHHEGELAVVIGRRTKRASEEEAAGAILGYTCANDVTARDIQRREGKYTRGKGFDTFCPLGPCIVTADEFTPEDHEVTCRVNGVVRQHSGIDDLIFGIRRVVCFISEVMMLLPGDVVLTGTPMGVGELVDGDVVEVEIDGIGVLQNRVVRAERFFV